eukprot:Nk52_evm5s805 gene=Nk52_evmTU5s805
MMERECSDDDVFEDAIEYGSCLDLKNEAELEVDDEFYDSNDFVSFEKRVHEPENIVSERGLPAGLGLTDEEILEGFGLFFMNRHSMASDFFNMHEKDDPLFAIGLATVTVLKAVTTLDKNDISKGREYLRNAQKVAERCRQAAPGSGALNGLKKIFGGGGSRSSSPVKSKGSSLFEETLDSSQMIHYDIIQAESLLLDGTLLLLQEDVVSLMKGGYKIHSSWKIMSRLHDIYLYQTTDHFLENYNRSGKLKYQVAKLDEETRGAIEFNVGVFNFTNSMLPEKLLRLVKFLGFPAKREIALDMLNKCLSRRGVRSPVACLVLLMYHVVTFSFFTFRVEHHIKEAEKLFEIYVDAWYPKCGLFLFLKGRLLRLKGCLKESIPVFKNSITVQEEWVQLQHLGYYELGWTYFYMFDFAEARKCFVVLEEENNWSKPFYMYMVAICDIKLGQRKAALKRLRDIKALETRSKKFAGGKTLSVEQFVFRKVDQYVLSGSDSAQENVNVLDKLIFPEIEMIHLWNGFFSMPPESLNGILEMLDIYIQDGVDNDSADNIAMVYLWKSAILRVLLRSDAAEEALEKLFSLKKNSQEDTIGKVKNENYTIPYGRYEAVLLYLDQLEEEKQSLESSGSPMTKRKGKMLPHRKLYERVNYHLKKAEDYSADFNFEVRLRLRLHLARDYIKRME